MRLLRFDAHRNLVGIALYDDANVNDRGYDRP